MGGVRVTRCFCKSCGGRATHESEGLLLDEGRLRGLRQRVGGPKFAVIPIHLFVGRGNLTGLIITLTGNGGRCSGQRSVGRGSSHESVTHVFGE